MSGLPEGMANGPNSREHLEKDDHVWERPWSLEEMRQNSANWSLAADSGLFLFLQDFSQRMLSKTHEIEKQLDSLIRDTKATDSCLHSVFNDFLMLSNTQFIENRVYDEEVEDALPKGDVFEKQPEQEKSREQKEAELIPKMQEAVNYGLKVLESAFEHLDIKAGNSDSEDEEVTDRVEAILEPKDLYVERPLPYLIGSQAFMEQDDVGLGDLSSDEISVDSDRDSVIDSDDGKEGDQHSDEDFNHDEEEEPIPIKKKSSMMSYDDEEDEDEDSDIFGESDKEDDDTKSTGPSSFADELAARIKGEMVNKDEGDRASLTSKKKSKGRKESKASKTLVAEEDSEDMFKPPKMNDDDLSPFGGKSGLFSGGKGLFDDDDEGDLFSDAPKPLPVEEKKAVTEGTKSTAQPAEINKPGKKIPVGAVSIFPDNSLFSSGNESESEDGKENGTSALKTNTVPKRRQGGGGGLFDEEEEDDFFGGKILKKSDSAGQERSKPKKNIDLFDDDEDGDIFSESALTPSQSKTGAETAQVKVSEKKMPAGAISMFGPGTKNLLNEGLRKKQQSTSEVPEKSEENGPALDVGQAALEKTQKPETRGLFSDDEDTEVFPKVNNSQSKPEPVSQGSTSKAALSFFDDEEEEDLFSSAAKSTPKPNQSKASTPQPSKTLSNSLFSDDDEDPFISSKTKSEIKTRGMKTSASAPSNLPGVKVTQKSSLFDDDDDDLFTPTKESSHKKPQRVALLFEDEEEDDDKGSFFGVKPVVDSNAATPDKITSVAPPPSSPLEKSNDITVPKNEHQEKLSEVVEPAMNTPKTPSTSQPSESDQSKKKPAGAISLFGGIDILAGKKTKNQLDEANHDDIFFTNDTPPPNIKKDEKVRSNTLSLFDEDEVDWNDPIFTPSKPTTERTQMPTEERSQAKSTGVFQDEELLFSQTQQKDNDPDVDLFATSGKAASSKLTSAKPAAQSLFADDDEDDLFSSVKPKITPPKVAEKPRKPESKAPLASPEPVSETEKPPPSLVIPKDSSSRIGKLQASLKINPAALLPGAAASMPGAVSVLPGLGPSSSSGVSSSSLSPSPVTSPAEAPADSGVSFDAPALVSTLQSANKSRAKGSVHRRPQSRAARQQLAQRSTEDTEKIVGGDTLVVPTPEKSIAARVSPPLPTSIAPTSSNVSSSSKQSPSPNPPRPSELTLPVSANVRKKDLSKDANSSIKELPSSDEDDLFGFDSMLGASSVATPASTRETNKTTPPQASSKVGLKKDEEKSTIPSIFDAATDDLFQKVKPRVTTKKASAFLEDDDEDIFGLSNSSTPTPTSSKEIKNNSSLSKQDIFQDEVTTVPKVHKKHKEKSIDATLFDDDVDIFADLTDTLKSKQKSKTKGETKSIFDADIDDIFSPSTAKPVVKAPVKSKKTPPPQESTSSVESSSIFDDPLNALGGN